MANPEVTGFATFEFAKKGKKHLPKNYAAKIRYILSDSSIAKVDKNGKIKEVCKGSCIIYVYSINGLMKKVNVTVK